MFEKIKNPDAYHGNNKRQQFFEGWYFKLVQPNTGNVYCFIPGIFISPKEGCSHSFIQVINGKDNSFKYLKFQENEFKASTTEFKLCIDECFFSSSRIKIKLKGQKEEIYGTLYFDNLVKWPDSIINPGSMGMYNYLGFMQCYSQVCVIDGYVNGELIINGENVDFTGGKVYIEKNWGKTFPNSYIWFQGNSFEAQEGSVTCSIGNIPLPFPIKNFTGFLIGINANGSFYKFTSINRSRLKINYSDEKMVLSTSNKHNSLKIEATYQKANFIDLYAPSDEGMIPTAHETLKGYLKVTLYDKRRNCILFNGNCSSAGVEFFNSSSLLM